ncbi:hypothetical protein PIB30_063870 [Stylosanthes scabra]|uniref:RNase H type-1 domain-containing protein n=1 Tax=Stylosanthes scabra TaxID=79078 RepID=A0ABU6SLJ8_9FABA|nr:hypothetical protein [Stylosanthes scabra]
MSEIMKEEEADAAFKRESSQSATSAIFRDCSGRMLTGLATRIKTVSLWAAETEAIRSPLITARNLKLEQVIIESDNLTLVQAIKSNTTIQEVDAILQDVRKLAREIPHCGFTWTPRDENRVADLVATLAAADSLHPNWSSNPPFQVKEMIRRELFRG